MTATKDRPAHPARLGALSPEALLEHVLDTMDSGLFTVDADGAITSFNRAMEQLTGYAADEMIGQPCSVLDGNTCFLGPLGEGRMRCPLFACGRVDGKRCQITHRSGRIVPVLKHARVMRDGSGRIEGAIEAVTDLTATLELEGENAALRQAVAGRARFGRLIGRHPSMQRLYHMIDVAARSPSAVLINGETGTGKELIAHAIHHASARQDGPFVRVSCAALSPTLLESELFGHVRGAFTGASYDRKGRFEAASGGTLFLDEIGDISIDVQKKLLRVLQEHEVERVGDNRSIPVDIRVVAATNQDLVRACEEGRFRSDLYYRIAVIPVQPPPLRARKSDIPLLVDWFIERMNKHLGATVEGLTVKAMARLMAHDWPGNVRELQHAIEYAFAVTSGPLVRTNALPPTMGPPQRQPVCRQPARGGRRGARPDAAGLREALAMCEGNRTRTAELLGVSRVTLWKWLKQLDEGA